MAEEHQKLLDRVVDTQADVLVTFYHGCHAAFLPAEKTGAFRVLNFTDLLVEALGGTPHRDVLKHYRLQDDLKFVIEEGEAFLRHNGLTVDPQFLEEILPQLFSLAEFKGGLNCFA